MSAAPQLDADTVLQARDLTRIYHTGETEVRALDGVSLDLVKGELVVLLGPSGSGKSTLLNILGGLDAPSSGSVLIPAMRGPKGGPLDLARTDEAGRTRYRRDQVGFIFQFYNLIPSLTARENVSVVTEIAPDPLSADEALELVGLSHRLDHFPSELSGGEQQRVAVARAIAKRPHLLFADEPTGALDSTTGRAVLRAVDRVNREIGAATVVITHNAGIGKMADRVIHFADGKILKEERHATRTDPDLLSW